MYGKIQGVGETGLSDVHWRIGRMECNESLNKEVQQAVIIQDAWKWRVDSADMLWISASRGARATRRCKELKEWEMKDLEMLGVTWHATSKETAKWVTLFAKVLAFRISPLVWSASTH